MIRTTTRVSENTAEPVNAAIRRQSNRNIICHAMGGREAIDQRLQELDEEWDIERTLEANAAAISMIGVVLGMVASRKWFVVPGIVGAFLMQHAVQGWCPPVPVLRRLGFRTEMEIQRERYALKALRGDFAEAKAVAAEPAQADVSAVLRAVDL